MELNKICRTCLKTDFVMEDIYNIEKVGLVDFVQVLLECTSIKIKKKDKLPKKICLVCKEYIKKYYKFKQKCLQSQDKLLHYIKNNTEASIKYNETLDNYKIENFEYSDHISKLEAVTSEENDEADVENATKNNNKYSEFINNYNNESLNKNQLINESEHILNEQMPFSTIVIKTEIKSEFEDEDENGDENKNNSITGEETFSDDNFFKDDELEKKNFTCFSCNEIFVTEDKLRKHIRQVHDKGVYSYLCHICSKLMNSRSTWQYHIMTHKPESERNYVCPKCDKRFISSTLYKRHLSVHTETTRKFTCHVCPARFKYKRGCIKHINSVHSDKTYCCKICQKAFNRLDNLKQHAKIHTGERPHVCNICGKDFLYIHVLRSHLKNHEINK